MKLGKRRCCVALPCPFEKSRLLSSLNLHNFKNVWSSQRASFVYLLTILQYFIESMVQHISINDLNQCKSTKAECI